MKRFVIETEESESSEIVCGQGAFAQSEEGADFVFTDSNVLALYENVIKARFANAPVYAMPAGEEHKTQETLFALLAAMKDAGLHRGDTLCVVGGGVAGDVGGLAAALYMRGISCIQVPTTLLAQVDSSVGGKTAIDFGGVKNLIGVFRQPKKVLADGEFLKTLPPREVRCGLGEIVKHAALNKPLFQKLWSRRGELHSLDLLSELVPENIQIKADVVRRDAREGGYRKCLNLGHTTAHAFELADKKLSHGEYVLLGILFEARLASRHANADREYLENLCSLAREGLGSLPSLSPAEEAAEFARLDKKNESGELISVTAPLREGEFVFLELPFREYAERLKEFREELC